MKINLALLFLLCFTLKNTLGQTSGKIFVGGDFDKFYPVVFGDSGWSVAANELVLTRSDVHEDGDWHGSLIAKLRFHSTNWGHGSQFIDADIKQYNEVTNTKFIAGWKDGTTGGGHSNIIIWLRGATHYNYRNNAGGAPAVYDGIQNPLPYNQPNAPSYTFTTTIEPYVNSTGISNDGTAYFIGNGTNTFIGSVSIGGYDNHGYKLSVNGNIRAKEVKVESGWADYVFEPSYKLRSLKELESFIKANRHLPDLPAANTVQNEGIELGTANALLLQKIEELTLYVIELKKEIDALKTK